MSLQAYRSERGEITHESEREGEREREFVVMKSERIQKEDAWCEREQRVAVCRTVTDRCSVLVLHNVWSHVSNPDPGTLLVLATFSLVTRTPPAYVSRSVYECNI